MRNLKPSRANMLLAESTSALDQLNNDIVAAQERLIGLIKSAGAWTGSGLGLGVCPSPDSHSTVSGVGNVSPATAGKKDRRKFVLRRKKNKSSSQPNAEPTASASVSESESGILNWNDHCILNSWDRT